MNKNKLKWKSKHFNGTVVATLGKDIIQFQIEDGGLTRYIDTMGWFCDPNELKILMDELNREMPSNYCVCLKNGSPKYMKMC